MDFQEYKKWFVSIFGHKATKIILDDENECISKKEDELWYLFKTYERFESIPDVENGFIIKGCTECISKGINVRKQDTPGFLGKLNEIRYVIIGLEVNIPKKYIEKGFKCDIHVAFNQFTTNKKEHRLFTKLRLFFPQIKEKAYVSDIAKCRSTNLHQSRLNCLNTHFFKELRMLLEFSPDLKIIFQGTSVEDYFSKNLKLFSTLENDEIKSDKKYLFKRRYLKFDNREIPTVTFPHATVRTSSLWNEIEKEEVSVKIKQKLKEFKFD